MAELSFGEFRWTPSRRKRLANVVRKHNRAIARRAERLRYEGREDLVAYLPPKASAAEVRSRVKDVNDFRRIVGYRNDAKRGRYSELERVSLPDALDFTTSRRGTPSTKYAERQYRYDRQKVTRNTRDTREALTREIFAGDKAYDFGDIGEQEYANVADNADVRTEDEGVRDDSVEELPQSTYDKWDKEDARRKRESSDPGDYVRGYLDAWKNPMNMHDSMAGYQQLIDDLEWLCANHPDYVRKMFAVGYDELDIQWIIESGGRGRQSNPYANVPYEERHDRAVAFVHQIRTEVERGELG